MAAPARFGPARWVIAAPDPALVATVAAAAGVPRPVAEALVNRGVTDAASAATFLEPRLADLNDPLRMRDMDLAVARTVRAIEAGERVCVHGDYDADGLTATALLSCFFEAVGAPVATHVPDRFRDGYGLSADRVRAMAAEGVKLAITVDCGVTAVDEVVLARALGVDVVVLDHHQPGGALPDAVAVVDPHRADCGFPFKDLSAAGIAFYFAGAVRRALVSAGRLADKAVDLRPLLDLAAIGTIADVVPLLGDNRVLAAAGVRRLNESPRLGLVALKAVAGIGGGKPVTSGNVAFQLAPRLNATGRLGDAAASLSLLLARDPEEAKRYAEALDRENSARRGVEAGVLASAVAQVEAAGGATHRIVIAAGDGWHPGVVGIVASRLVERYCRPAVVIGIEDDMARGSCRSVRGFDIGQALARVGGLLVRHGGHAMAAGLTLHAARLADLFDALHALADREVPDESLVPSVRVDAVVRPEEADEALLAAIARLQPFGMGNPEPVLALLDVPVRESRRVGAGQEHVQLRLGEGATPLRAIWFEASDQPRPGSRVDVAFTLSADDMAGGPRLKVKDVRPATAADRGMPAEAPPTAPGGLAGEGAA
ncbi:MAG: single-stranded-DNA-specific exonuclease RecJ [Deltaproteobacteria bacterium]|nr:single-stranded-DNA-specific exonuclease RecJ [Deltaproteobacteria bacterium]